MDYKDVPTRFKLSSVDMRDAPRRLFLPETVLVYESYEIDSMHFSFESCYFGVLLALLDSRLAGNL